MTEWQNDHEKRMIVGRCGTAKKWFWKKIQTKTNKTINLFVLSKFRSINLWNAITFSRKEDDDKMR